jgi:hypothetical protein
MRGRHHDLGPGPRREQGFDAAGYGAAGRDHVVYDQACSARDLSDDVSHLGLAAAYTFLVQLDHRSAETLRAAAGHPRVADVRRHHHVGRQPVAERLAQRRHRRQAVDWGMKEALDLRRVQVDVITWAMPTACIRSATTRAMIGSRRPAVCRPGCNRNTARSR